LFLLTCLDSTSSFGRSKTTRHYTSTKI